MADYLNFGEIYAAVEAAVTQSGSKRDVVKAAINMVYLTEILEADDLYPLYWLRKMDDSLAAKAPSVISGITPDDPAIITTDAEHGLVVGDIVSIYQIAGTIELNNRTYKVATTPLTTTLTLIDLEGADAIDASSMGAYTSGGIINHRGLTLATVDVKNILNVAFHDYRGSLSEISPEQLEEQTNWWDENTTRPTRYMHRKIYSSDGVEVNQLLWFPGSDAAYDLRYWTEIRTARLSGNSDVPILPPQFHDAIIAGAITRLIESQVQVENAVIWPSIYSKHLSDIATFNRKYYERHEDEKRDKPYLL